jgi:hypothetical protein
MLRELSIDEIELVSGGCCSDEGKPKECSGDEGTCDKEEDEEEDEIIVNGRPEEEEEIIVLGSRDTIEDDDDITVTSDDFISFELPEGVTIGTVPNPFRTPPPR